MGCFSRGEIRGRGTGSGLLGKFASLTTPTRLDTLTSLVPVLR